METETLDEKRLKQERINRLVRIIKDQIIDLRLLGNGELMSNKLFRLALKENSNLSQRLNDLEERKFKLERLFWRIK